MTLAGCPRHRLRSCSSPGRVNPARDLLGNPGDVAIHARHRTTFAGPLVGAWLTATGKINDVACSSA